VLLAALQTYLDGRLEIVKALVRGVATAVVAALGFGIVLFQLYRGWPPQQFSFVTHFVAWSLAYLPGLYVLLKR
jgi:high-affinity Fe2+/Pb2+ permease